LGIITVGKKGFGLSGKIPFGKKFIREFRFGENEGYQIIIHYKKVRNSFDDV